MANELKVYKKTSRIALKKYGLRWGKVIFLNFVHLLTPKESANCENSQVRIESQILNIRVMREILYKEWAMIIPLNENGSNEYRE